MIKINIESDPKFKKPNDSVIFSLISYVMEQQEISDADLLFIFGDDKLLNHLKKQFFNKDHFTDVIAFRRDEGLELPGDLDYSLIGGLSREAQEKLSKAAPRTLGQAGRVPGVTPAAMVALLRYVRRDSGEKKSQLKLA